MGLLPAPPTSKWLSAAAAAAAAVAATQLITTSKGQNSPMEVFSFFRGVSSMYIISLIILYMRPHMYV
jgi:hypothetical protein